MDSLVSDIAEIDSNDPFVTGRYSDFSLKVICFVFKVHKIVVCPKSKYFENLCSSSYIEGQQGFGELENTEDPAMVARLLQTMYQGDYGNEILEKQLDVLMRNSFCDDLPMSLATAHIDRVSCLTHAKMYAMGDAYEFPFLAELAQAKFVEAMQEADFSLEELVAAIDIVYATTPDENSGLRKHVVFMAQSRMSDIKKLESFQNVFEKYIGFCWDFGLEYGARRTLWCANCQTNSKIPTTCSCGFHGLCGILKACNEMSWDNLKCSNCKKAGSLVREKPDDNDEVRIVCGGKRRGPIASPVGTRSTKRRKSSL